MSKEEKRIQIYALWILRKDDQHIEVIESSKYDEVFEVYQKIKDKWTSSIKDRIPFELTAPMITVFDPGLIYEITIKLVSETPESRYDNPYQKQAQKNGFMNTFRQPQSVQEQVGDLLDGGYK